MTDSTGVTTLTTSTAILVTVWSPDISQAWLITAILAGIIIVNLFGIRIFAEVEYACGFLKVLLLVGLTILMLAINRGGNQVC